MKYGSVISMLDVVAVHDMKAGDEVTLDYCACSATVDHRRMVLGPFDWLIWRRWSSWKISRRSFDYVPENRRVGSSLLLGLGE